MVTALWLGMFKKEIIDNAHIEFDKYIRHEEDWLFLRNISNMSKKFRLLMNRCIIIFKEMIR